MNQLLSYFDPLPVLGERLNPGIDQAGSLATHCTCQSRQGGTAASEGP